MTADKEQIPLMPYVMDGKGRKMRRIKAEVECRDCGARKGERHNHLCKKEACPRCKGKLIECPCKFVYYVKDTYAEQ